MRILAGRYELGEELGSGAVGHVVAAHDQMLGRDVAVKLLSPAADAVTRQRFVREARAAARLHHPNAVAVYDTGEADGQPYLVMELVRGRTLADVLAQDGPLDVEEAVAITVGVLDGLAAAHRAGMVHRDVKPGNVLLPDEGGVKLSDFGIAKALDDDSADVTAVGVLMGTPTYLAPELLIGHPPSPASDVYGVGCLLYAELTGDPPFTKGDAMTIAYAHRNEPVPPVTTRRPEVPADLAAVVGRALAKDPADRYDSASAMRTALLEGPAAVPAPEDAATVAVPVAGARDGTQVLDRSEDPTREIGAAAPAAGTAGAAPAGTPARRRRSPWPAVAVVLAVLLLVLALWLLLDGDDPEEVPLDDGPEELEEELEEDPEEPVDDPPDDPPAEDEPEEEPEEPIEDDEAPVEDDEPDEPDEDEVDPPGEADPADGPDADDEPEEPG